MGSLRFGVPSSKLQEKKWVPPGIYEFRIKGFKPDFTKAKTSINLNPELEIVNTPGTFLCDDPDCATKHDDGQGNPGHAFNGNKPAFLSGNEGAMFIVVAMVHSLGFEMVEGINPDTGEPTTSIPGKFNFVKADDPRTWTYEGPLTDSAYTGKLEVSHVDTIEGGRVTGHKNNIRMFVCKVPGCTQRHPSDLK